MSSDFGASIIVQKLIKLTVNKCQVQNWQKCSNLSTSVWSMWSSDYTLKSGSWIIASDTAQALGITVTSIIGASLLVVTFVSFMNPASTASLWSMINQAQLLFLLFLTGAFIPLDVQKVILGAKFTLNIAFYFDYLKIDFIRSIIEEFDFKLNNQSLELLGIQSNSSIYNIYSIIVWGLTMIQFHLFVYLLYKLMPTEEPQGRWKFAKKISIKFVNKLFIMFTFGWYIRYIFETNQYVLLSSVNELYSFTASDSKRIISLSFSILVLLLCLCLIICVSSLQYHTNFGIDNHFCIKLI